MAPPLFRAENRGVWAFLIWERIGIAGNIGAEKTQDNNFTVSGAKDLGIDISVSQLMDTCLAENDRRLEFYDLRLLRPMFVPRMVRLARRFMRNPKPASS